MTPSIDLDPPASSTSPGRRTPAAEVDIIFPSRRCGQLFFPRCAPTRARERAVPHALRVTPRHGLHGWISHSTPASPQCRSRDRWRSSVGPPASDADWSAIVRVLQHHIVQSASSIFVAFMRLELRRDPSSAGPRRRMDVSDPVSSMRATGTCRPVQLGRASRSTDGISMRVMDGHDGGMTDTSTTLVPLTRHHHQPPPG